MTVSPELLAAYADCELDAETARTVEAEIAGNEQLQADLATHRALRARLSAHFAPIAEQPIPDRLRQMVLRADQETSSIIDFAAQAQRRRTPIWPARWARYVGPALAATVVVTPATDTTDAVFQSVPSDGVITYGLFLTLILALVYAPTSVHITRASRALVDAVCPLPPLVFGTPEEREIWTSRNEARTKLETQFELSSSPLANR